jgi:hypothetical protein
VKETDIDYRNFKIEQWLEDEDKANMAGREILERF